MLTNRDVTDLVRGCPTSIPRERMFGSFYPSTGLSVYWSGGIKENKMEIRFPDYLRDAPGIVITDLTKKMIQRVLYDSDYTLSRDTKSWLMAGFYTPEKVKVFCQRNGLTEIAQYNDAIIVTSDGDILDSSPFFRIISIPRDLVDSPDREKVISDVYKMMVSNREEFLEA